MPPTLLSQIQITGDITQHYISDDSSMPRIAVLHQRLENMRQAAAKSGAMGPKVCL